MDDSPSKLSDAELWQLADKLGETLVQIKEPNDCLEVIIRTVGLLMASNDIHPDSKVYAGITNDILAGLPKATNAACQRLGLSSPTHHRANFRNN